MKRFDDITENILIQSGWISGRRVDFLVSKWKQEIRSSDHIEMFLEAELILAEFGAIKVEKQKCASSQSFEINPSLAVYEGDRFIEYSNLVGTSLYPLGEAFSGHYFLAVGENGKVFWLAGNIYIIGNCFDEALGKMISGYQPKHPIF